jgi:hypothetical protein
MAGWFLGVALYRYYVSSWRAMVGGWYGVATAKIGPGFLSLMGRGRESWKDKENHRH